MDGLNPIELAKAMEYDALTDLFERSHTYV